MRRLAESLLKLRGWRFLGELPPVPKMVIVGAPHTSNWDFVVFLAAMGHWRVRPRFLAKHTLFSWPLGQVFARLGGIPVDRRRAGGVVGQVAEAFASAEELILVVAPEGTRRPVTHWRSGFLEIAQAADVPIVPAYIDYPGSRVELGEPIHPHGDPGAIMERLRSFMRQGKGLRPEGMGPVRLEGERP